MFSFVSLVTCGTVFNILAFQSTTILITVYGASIVIYHILEYCSVLLSFPRSNVFSIIFISSYPNRAFIMESFWARKSWLKYVTVKHMLYTVPINTNGSYPNHNKYVAHYCNWWGKICRLYTFLISGFWVWWTSLY